MQLIQKIQDAYYKAVAMEFPQHTVIYFRHNKAQVTPTKAIVHHTIADLVTVRYEDQHGRVKYKSAIYSRFSKELT